MQKLRFILLFPLIGFIDLIVRGDLKSLHEILMFSAIIGGIIGILMGVIMAVVEKSVELGIWILAGSVFGCALFLCGLIGLIVVLMLVSNVLQGRLSLAPSTSSSSDTPPAAAEAVGLVLFSLLLVPVALAGGAIGAHLYRDRHQHRE